MLKLKLQNFGHLMRRADSLEKTLMLGKTEGRRRREKQIADGGRLAGAGMGGLFTPPSAPGQPLMVRCHKPSLLELSDQVLEGSRI